VTGSSVAWGTLEHAFGRASDVPALLDAIGRTSGRQLRKLMGDLCERVLHQGTIYSASPPAVHGLIAISTTSRPRDRALFYDVLGEFAAAARQAVRHEGEGSCCEGDDPADGRAILSEILQTHDRFAADLLHPDPSIRGLAATLLTASAETGPAVVNLVRDRYFAEPDAAARICILQGLTRVRGTLPDWRAFLAAALDQESDPSNRFALRRAELREWKSQMPPAAVDELISRAVQSGEADALGDLPELGPERETAALLQALSATDRDFLRRVSERLLRAAFQDRRTGWENTTHSVVRKANSQPQNGHGTDEMFKAAFKLLLLALLGKIFPFLLRRILRKADEARSKRPARIEYWKLEDSAPVIPAKLTHDQQIVLTKLAGKSEVWFDSTNLWECFGLPDTPQALRDFVAARS
jgi:hypothetical protein